jgi:membrane associated rhomboid family serine protease
MFVRVQTRSRARVPWATLLLTLAAVGAYFALALTVEPGRHALVLRWGAVPDDLFGGVPWWSVLANGEILTLLTALLVHAAWPHLIGNLAFLLIFGLSAERVLGSRRFLALFVICGMLANLAAALMLRGSLRPIIGMSGAVSAIVGAYIALFPRSHLGLVLPLGFFLEFVRIPAIWLIGFWILIQVTFSLVGPSFGQVAWAAHIVGFIAGVLFALASREGISRRQRNL